MHVIYLQFIPCCTSNSQSVEKRTIPGVNSFHDNFFSGESEPGDFGAGANSEATQAKEPLGSV